jgi:hypothetical protein|eukprot:SAG25_NODE_618_length_6422_cov_3.817894_12_plen_59_part_00
MAAAVCVISGWGACAEGETFSNSMLVWQTTRILHPYIQRESCDKQDLFFCPLVIEVVV